VRKLKAETKDKTIWQPEVNKLLELKKNLAEAQKNSPNPNTLEGTLSNNEAITAIEKEIAAQAS
jgi:methionyl-tRNA synthetase